MKWSLCLQSPIAAHSAANGVDCGPARVIEVQPNLAIERQAILIGGAQAATPFADAQATVRRHAKSRVTLPFTGHIGLRRINAFSAFGSSHTQAIGAGKTPDFFASPETIDRRSRQNLRDTAAARGQRQGKMSGPHLHAHGTIGVDTHRQLAAECHRREPGGQWAGELHFAPLARDVQAQLRRESHRNVIFDQSIDLYFERVGGGSGGSRAQRNRAFRTRGLPDQSTIDGECDQRRLWRHRQLRRPLRPTETSTQQIAARRQTRLRLPATHDHRQSRAVGLDVDGPVFRAARKYQPTLSEDFPSLRKIAAMIVDGQGQYLRPGAAKSARIL